jgi:Zn-dependent protease
MFLFSGMKLQPIYYLCFLALIIIHEIGHALTVKAYGFRNHELIINGLGGACVWSGSATPKQLSVIAWGGIIAQLIVFTIFSILSALFTIPPHDFIDQIFRAFIGTNFLLIVINLIPYDPLDGAQAWKLFAPIWSDFRSLKNRQSPKNLHKKVDDKIIRLFKDNSTIPNKGSQRTRAPRR